MATIKQVQKRKLELLERYRSTQLEQRLLVARQQALEEAERGRFPWKGEFRPKEEIELLYSERKKWDRRFLIDGIILTVVLFAITIVSSMLVNIVSTRPSVTRETLQQERAAGRTPANENPAADDSASDG